MNDNCVRKNNQSKPHNKRNDRENRIMYKVCVCLLPIFLLLYFTFLLKGDWILASGKPCVFKEQVGFYCPGCGGTRSFYYFTRMNLLESFRYHFAVPLIILEYLAYLLDGFLHNTFRNIKFKRLDFFVLMYISLGMIILQWIVKNVFLFGTI